MSAHVVMPPRAFDGQRKGVVPPGSGISKLKPCTGTRWFTVWYNLRVSAGASTVGGNWLCIVPSTLAPRVGTIFGRP